MRPNLNNRGKLKCFAVESIWYDFFTIVIVISGFLFSSFSSLFVVFFFFTPLPAVVSAILVIELSDQLNNNISTNKLN